MPDGRHSAARGRDDRAGRHHRPLANGDRLEELGTQIEQSAHPERVIRTRRPRARRTRRRAVRLTLIVGITLVGLVVALVGGGYLYARYRFGQIPKINVAGELPQISGQPFNILEVGSDSRAGLTGQVARQTGASAGLVSGQRSDVVKIMHIDPAAGTITIVSIPRDTMVTLLANQRLYGQFNRINVNYADGPSLLAQTITANFGIPINHVIQVSFAGLINAADAIGGVYLDFPYPAKDAYSGLKIPHAGCQLVTGFQALAVARSRHYQWFQGGVWHYDPTSDFGRIDRQNVFIRALISRAKHLYNPLTINSFLSKIPQGITLDSGFTLNELIGLAVKFHSYNPANMLTYTLPTVPATISGLGDVLFAQEPQVQQLLVKIFGSSLLTPTNPPPNQQLQTPLPPKIAPTTTTTTIAPTSTTATKGTTTTVRRTTPVNPTTAVPYFDPVPCSP
ncbi:MAG: LCP family protein [Acidimicrobiales bacterium]